MRRLPGLLSRISFRLLAFNLLIVFLPIAAFLYLDTYERQLLRSLEHALIQQARVLAAALSNRGPLGTGEAQRILTALEQRQEARLRVVDGAGRLLADSSRLGPQLQSFEAAGGPEASDGATPPAPAAPTETRLLYRLASAPVRLYRRLPLARWGVPEPPLPSAEFYVNTNTLLGPEVRDALQGRYGAITRISTGGQRSVTLYSAVPVRDGQAVAGAVLASQSTFRILRDLYDLRLQVFRIFLVSVAAAVALSLLLATTISAPVRRLREQARQILDRRGRLRGKFSLSRRRDEIGDLARALQELTEKLQTHLRFVESFAGDLAHELRNPLASIRSAAEVLPQVEDDSERALFLASIRREVARMETLLAAVGEISRVDARIEEEERQSVDLGGLAAGVVQALGRRAAPGPRVELRAPDAPLWVNGVPMRLTQIVENLLDNALSFSPADGKIQVLLERRGTWVMLQVLDRGPGVPPGHLGRVFDRFFSFRPDGAGNPPGDRPAGGRSEHLGLGLSIVKTVVVGYGGSVSAANREGGGACFEVLLPLAVGSGR